jgi:hypothetical protein
MTLLVAAIDGPNVWMAVDAAITGVGTETRQREFALKVIASEDKRSLLGFAGDLHHGSRLVVAASASMEHDDRLRLLSQGQREVPSVNFAYAYIDGAGPHLMRVMDGEVRELPALNLGVSEAFTHFQRIRHDTQIDHAPEAVKSFFVGSKASEPVPPDLSLAITSMLRLFAERSERDVGGWVTPYFLTRGGAFLCGYGYCVSDPILTKIGPGSSVPHGTAEAGGFGLSVTELGNGDGVVVYWMQQPGGMLFLRKSDGYQPIAVEGGPSEFIERASTAAGQKVEIFFSDQPHGPPESIIIMRDENGIPSMAIARQGKAFSLSVLNVATPFRSRAALDLAPVVDPDTAGLQLSSDRLKADLSHDRAALNLGLVTDGQVATEVSLTSSELDLILGALGEKRWMMRDQVAKTPTGVVATGSVTRELMVVDPAWRTDLPVHPTLNGITLRLRHPGFGWLTFLLPWHEAKALGEWLVKNSPPGGRIESVGN